MILETKLWMGGPVPLGYSLVDKMLVVNDKEAALVRRIFERYCALGCVQALKHELDQAGTQGRSRLQRDGNTRTVSFSRGGLYAILNRRAYLGEVHHKGEWFAGQHTAIVPTDLWQRVETKLERNRHERKLGTNVTNASLLAGMVFDGAGRRLIATHTTKGGKRYRYYLNRHQEGHEKGDKRTCLPAHDVERIATEQWLRLLTAADLDTQLDVDGSADSAFLRSNAEHLAQGWSAMKAKKQREVLLTVGLKVLIKDRQVEVSAEPERLSDLLLKGESTAPHKQAEMSRRVSKVVNASLIKAAGETRILEVENSAIASALTPGHQALLKAIAQGRAWAKALTAGEFLSAEEITRNTGLSAAHVARGLKCINVPPDVIATLVEGKAPANLTWAAIRPMQPIEWDLALHRWRTAVQH